MSPHPWKTRLDRKELFVSTSPSTAPLNIELVDPFNYHGRYHHSDTREVRILIDADTDRSEKYIKSLLGLIKSDVHAIHFVRGQHMGGGEFVRGALLVDGNGSVVMHVVNALIGYDGSGPNLSRNILEMFGFSREAFDNINDSARSSNQHYALIVHLV